MLNDYGERMARAMLDTLPDGGYTFRDTMDDDGQGNRDIPLRVCVLIG